jgi:NAD dependent epimerase/dehydratase family
LKAHGFAWNADHESQREDPARRDISEERSRPRTPGVRYSLVNPHAYIRSNLDGFVNILETCRHSAVRHLIYASSSSVYGAVMKMPFSVHQNVDHPVSIYGASKKANGLPTTGRSRWPRTDPTP